PDQASARPPNPGGPTEMQARIRPSAGPTSCTTPRSRRNSSVRVSRNGPDQSRGRAVTISGSPEQPTNPLARGRGDNSLALGINVIRTAAMGQKDGDDPALLVLGAVRARIALSRVLHGEMERG